MRIGFVNAEGGQAFSFPQVREGVEAAVEYANAELGGIAGRPIELVICNTLGTPESSTGCANQLVDDDVNAVLLGLDGNSNAMAAIITNAGIPYLVAAGNSVGELTTDGAFSFTAGLPGSFGTLSSYGATQGWDNVALLPVNTDNAMTAIDAYAETALSQNGISFETTPLEPGAADVTPQLVQALANDPDAVWIATDAALCIAVMNAYQAIGADVPLVFASNACVSDAIEAASPPDVYTNATLFTSQFVGEGDAESELYLRVLEEYAPDSTPTAGFVQRGYAGMASLVRAVEGMTGDVTPETLRTAIQSAADVPLPLGGGLTFTCDGQVVVSLPSLCSVGSVVADVLGGGSYELISTEDVASLLE